MAEIIDLSDDDIVIEEVHRKKGPGGVKRPFRCLNSDCRAEKDLIRAEDFVRRYFGVLSYPKKKRVCITCLREAKSQQDYLVDTLRSRRLLLAEKLPPPKTTVVLTDSDSDPSDKNSSSAETDIEYEFDDGKTLEEAMSDLIVDLGLDRQITEGVKHLEERLLAVQEGFENLHTEEYSKIEGELDKVRKDFYNNFRPEIMWQPALDIGPSSTIVQQDGSGEVIAEPSVFVPNENLPPVGPLNRWELQPNELVYSMKYSLFARWVQAQVIEVERREAKNTTYKIRYNRNAKGSGLPRIMPGRQLAYINPCATRIPVGTRVIAKYRDDDPKNTTISGSFYVGVVAEIPTAANKYRYLIFFDDGYAQYVLHHDIRVVTESSVCPWEDVSSDSREFIKEYLQMYPERPMVRLQKWNYVKTEWNGRWWKAQVKEVDGSLVKMFFPLDGRSEWIYRGSTRLSPLFNKKLNIQAQAEQPLRTIRRRTAALPGRAVVEYGTFGQEQDIESSMTGKYPEASAIEAPGERRAVARKSTSSRPGTPPREVQLRVEQESKGFTNKHSFLEKIIRITPHTCSSKCLGASGDSMDKHKGLSPLLYPLLFGWHRTIIKQRRKTQSKNEICYVGPCGRRLRSIEEVFRYLRETESNLEIDCFSYETNIDVSHEWEPFKKILNVEDMSRGEENVPISCVNSLDEAVPQSLIYCNVRLPTEHVPLNLDPEFLVCCDCKDDCQDKSKCSCWQLTIEGTRILERNENSTAGYHYRRLFEQVQSGIYECNSRCKCSNHCLNRVVQHPLRLKLQLFKTARRGWGVRTLHDIPKGGFLCVYVGRMLNETIANEEGKIMGGDDYYAELDYIEVMENAKEGYEEEASTPDEEIGNNFAGEDRHIGGSESNESDGFYSENEVDNPKEDHDFNHPSHIKKAGFTKREKSARLQERAKHTKILVTDGGKEEGSGSGSTPVSDDETSKGTKKKNSERNCKKKEGAKDKETKAAKLLDAKKVDDKKADDKKADDKKADDKKADDKKDNSENMDEEEEQSDEGEDEADEQQRQPQTFAPTQLLASVNQIKPNQSVRDYFGKDEAVYIMDAKQTGNIGRFLNHSCEPNVFVQNAFVDTHDLRFPWVAFFAMVNIRAGSGGYVSEGEEKVVRAPGLGRITGSASIETLVRVGLEKEAGLSPDSKMVVLHDFTPCVDDELEVKRGSVVNVLYQENDWVYVIAEHGQQEGFIPHSYCAPFGSQLGELTMNHKKKMPREHNSLEGGGGGGLDTDHNTTIGTINSGGTDNPGLVGSDNESYGGKLIGSPPNRTSDSSIQSGTATPDIHPFFKDPAGRYIVLYTFIARDENDVSVERGEFVTVLNREDPDWYWVLRSDGQEGFVPSGFVYPADVIQDHLDQGGGTTGGGVMVGTIHGLGSVGGHQLGYGASQHHINPGNSDDLRFHGSELVMLYDYKAQAPDDLSVRRGDWIYADLNNQTVDGWLWAYAPKTRKYGFIPKAYARPPAMTSL